MMIVGTKDTPMIDLEQVAKQLGVSTQTVRRLVQKGELRAYRIGSQLRFKEEEVNAYIDAQVVSPDDVDVAEQD
jgi:excisionase family DNA binding protein